MVITISESVGDGIDDIKVIERFAFVPATKKRALSALRAILFWACP